MEAMTNSDFVTQHLREYARNMRLDAATQQKMLGLYLSDPAHYDGLDGWPTVLRDVEGVA